MPELKLNPTLMDFQDYVKALEKERGFDHQDAQNKCLMLGEEMGELFKAVRKSVGLSIDQSSRVSEISHELADIFIFICSIANRYQVDIERAFREKEEINKRRKWVSDPDI